MRIGGGDISDLFNFLRGYVGVKASGGFPERFLNLCSRGNIPYWDVCCTNGTVFMRTTPEGYKKMRRCAKKAGMRMKTVKKSGLPFWLFKNRVHAGLAVGALCFVLITAALSGRIWTVSVTGCETVPQEDIIEAVGRLGVCPGMRKKQIDTHSVAEEAMSALPEVSWLSVNISGCSAIIDVREGVGRTVKKDDSPCDIVAAEDGQIQTLEVFGGTAVQEQNSAVLKGDTIISGIVENRDGGMSLRRASGYVTALTKHAFSTESRPLPSRKISEIKSRYTLLFFSLKVPLGAQTDADFTEDRFLTLGGVKLPIGIRAERKYIFEPADAAADDLADLIALEAHFYKAADGLRDMLTMSRTTKERRSNGRAIFSSEYGCLQNIGEERRIEAGE